MNVCDDKAAVKILSSGGVGVLPTDTLYGIVARAADPQAVARMYALKQRESKPGTVIAANTQQLIDLGVGNEHVERVKQWWPGSLSVETPLGPELTYLHQGTGRQGFRVVPDERVRRILEQTGPLVTSSANQPGEDPANTIEDAQRYFGDSVDFYVDGGDRSGSKPSTIARITDYGIEIIRQGVVTIPAEALAQPASQPGCPFCLQNGLLDAPIIYQDEAIFVTTPNNAPGNYLVIPARHIEDIQSLPADWWKHVAGAFAHLPAQPEHFNISVNYGKPAGQSIRHLHFWIIPREDGKPSSGKGFARLISEVDSK